MSENKRVRVRFAPSPTGPLHIGGVRTALYNYLFAKHHGGDFLLRIEDTDQTRYVPGAEDYIANALRWCGITPDEGAGFGGEFGPYRQSERKEAGIYKEYVDQLIESGHAYYAFDTSEELDAMRERLKRAKVASPQYNNITRSTMKNSLSLSSSEVEKRMAAGEPYVVRIKMPRNEDIRFYDEIRGWVVVNTDNLDDKVLFKSDGMPTYHLANVVDDYLMKITHVIRGEEWLPSLPLHHYLYTCLGWTEDMPKFAHLPLILKPDGNGKLSKRDGDRLGFPVFPLQWQDPVSKEISSGYKENGYFPDAFINMLSFLGWNPGTPQEIFSLEELTQAFTLDRVGKAGAKFDADKTKWFNQQYLRMKNKNELAALMQPLLKEKGIDAEDSFVADVAELMKERAYFAKDLIVDEYYFTSPTEFDEKTTRKKWKENTPAIMKELISVFEGLENWTSENIESTFKAFLTEKELGMGAVLPNYRLLVTGKGMGPSMFEISSVIGKKETIDRMKNNISTIEALKQEA